MNQRSELRTILTADIPGFSGRLKSDPEGILHLLIDGFYALVDRNVRRHGGTVFRREGDAVWCSFGSAVAAVRAAAGIQEDVLAHNAREPAGGRFELRAGIEMGDVVLCPDGDVLGHALSVAKRLETACEPGAINLSGTVHAQVAGRPLPLDFEDLGEVDLKGIGPTRVHRARLTRERAQAAAAGGPTLAGERVLLAADLASGTAARESRTAWERDLVRLANRRGGTLLAHGEDVVFVLLPPPVTPDLVRDLVALAGPRRLVHAGDVLARTRDTGTAEELYGSAVEEAIAALREAGREEDVALMSAPAARQAAAQLVEESGTSGATAPDPSPSSVLRPPATGHLPPATGHPPPPASLLPPLEPAGTIPGASDVALYRVLRDGSARLASDHAPSRVIGIAGGPRAVDVVAATRRDESTSLARPSPDAHAAPPPPLSPTLTAIWSAVCAITPSATGRRPVLSSTTESALESDPALGLAVATALLSSLTGAAAPDSLAAWGVVSGDGSVAPPADDAARRELAAQLGCSALPALRSLAGLAELVLRSSADARVAALAAAHAAGRLGVVVAPAALGAADAAELAAQLAADLGEDAAQPVGKLAEEVEAELGRGALLARFAAWAASRGPSALAPVLEALRPAALVALFPDPRLAGLQAARVVPLGGTLDEPVLTDADLERALGRLAELDPAVRHQLGTQPLLMLGEDAGDPYLRAFHKQLRAVMARPADEPVVLVARSARDADRKWWERRGVEVLAGDPEAMARRIAAAPAPAGRQRVVLTRDRTARARPYKFLDYYGSEDHAIFFGRDREAAELIQRLLGSAVLVVYGKSGAGKTSLVRAGVLSRLPRPRHLSVIVRAIGDPAKLLRAELEPLCGGPPAASLGELAQRVARRIGGHLVLVLDQFEELFVRHAGEARDAMIRELCELARCAGKRIHLVLSLREDFLAELSAFERYLPSILDNRYRLASLTSGQAREAILGPAELFGLRLEDSVVDALVDELFEDGIDPPQLSIVCDRLWQARDGEGRVSGDAYRGLGGVRRILVGYLRSTLAEKLADHGALARRVLAALVTPRGTKAVVSLAEIAGAVGDEPGRVRSVVLSLVEARLVRELTQDEDHLFELAHEYLIEEVNGWLAEDELPLKHARIVLRQECESWARFGSLLGPDRLAVLEEQHARLTPDDAERALLLRAAAVHGRDITRWLGGAAPDVLVGLLEEKGTSGVVARRILRACAVLPVDGRAAEAVLAACERHGNPALMDELAGAWAAAARPALEAEMRERVRRRFFGDAHMARVPGGGALLGSSREVKDRRKAMLREDLWGRVDSERDLERVDVAHFLIDRHPVTNDEFAEFREAHRHRYPPGEGNHPAVYVSWYDACEYAKWLGKALPTEQEWEKAARGPDGTLFPWGDGFEPSRCNSAESGLKHTTPVDAYPQGASAYGCLDMVGNVWEWTASGWTEGSVFKTQKGGSTVNKEPLLHASARFEGFPDFILSWVGFRTVSRG